MSDSEIDWLEKHDPQELVLNIDDCSSTSFKSIGIISKSIKLFSYFLIRLKNFNALTFNFKDLFKIGT